jgi:hypothetical protein
MLEVGLRICRVLVVSGHGEREEQSSEVEERKRSSSLHACVTPAAAGTAHELRFSSFSSLLGK